MNVILYLNVVKIIYETFEMNNIAVNCNIFLMDLYGSKIKIQGNVSL